MNRLSCRILIVSAWLILSLLLVAPGFPAALAQGEAPTDPPAASPDPRPTGIPLVVPVEGEPPANIQFAPNTPPELDGSIPAPAVLIDGSAIIITWRSAVPERAWVIYGSSPDQLDQIAINEHDQISATRSHRATILAPSAGPLYYQIIVDGNPNGRMGKVLIDGPDASRGRDPENVPPIPVRLEPQLASAVAVTIHDFNTNAPVGETNDQPATDRSPLHLQSFAVEGHRFLIRLTGAPQALEPDDWSLITRWIDQSITQTLGANGAAMPPLVEYDIQLNGRYPELPAGNNYPPAIPRSLESATIQGKKIVLNPGHGRYEAGGWPTQRSYFFGAVEDFVNLDMVSALDASLASTGADRRPVRQLNRNTGNHPTSGRPWWEMGAREYMRYQGLPQSVWDQSNLSTLNRDLMARPNYANYIGADAMISIHNNGSQNGSGVGYGTETWYDTLNGHSAESLRLATLVHNKVVESLQRDWNPSWYSRGIKASAGGYGENRWFNGPAALIEVGFMDNAGDNAAIRDPRFQAIVAGAIKDALVEFYGGSSDPDDNRTIVSGQTLNGTISPNNDEDVYYFNASTNSRATIRMTRTSGTSLDSFLELYAPDGTLVTVDDDGAGNLNSLINNWPLPADGRYKIVARSWSRNSSGSYALNLSLGSGETVNCSDGQYRAQYYNNRDLGGSPAVTRCESTVNYDWGSGSPVAGVGSDNFSVRWTGRHNFSGGTWRFIARADDGIRVWIDGSLIIDAWRDQGPTEYRTERSLSAGLHEIKVEYYENGGGAVAQVRWETATTSCSPSADQVALFVDSDYRGQCVIRGYGNYANPAAIGMPNDSISSVIVGSNVRLTLFEHDDYAGRSSSFSGNDGNLSDNTIGNDSVSSLKVESRGGGTSGNLALNRPARASSQESDTYNPSRGNDGNNNTRWSSTISTTLGAQRWYVDLGSARSINRIRINWETSYAASYRIVWSDNGTNWFYYTNNQYTRSGPGWAVHTFSPWAHRYVGVTMLTRAPRMNNYSFWEFEIYGPALAGMQETPVTTPDSAIETDVLAPQGD